MEIRNIAIIAHIDHGKTTITDALLRQAGVAKEGVSMDSNTLEQERGITIYSKNAALWYKGTKINIVDTPGHADFGSEVERVLRSIDSVLLIVDAQEGPMPQTRFVLKKSLELGLRPIVVINKIDKPAADPAGTEEKVLELFLELGADEAQADFPVVYAIGRQGIAKKNLSDNSEDLAPLLETILASVPCAPHVVDTPLRLQPFNLGYDNFLGRLAIGRVYEGVVSKNQNVFIKKPTSLGPPRLGEAGASQGEQNGETRSGKIGKLFTFHGLEKIETDRAEAGDIVMISGLSDIDIGETVTSDEHAKPLAAIAVDEPTIALNFLVNNSPFGGREGVFVTSRQLRERLAREVEINVGLHVDFSSAGPSRLARAEVDTFRVLGRGELHIAILLETMRREGYEVQVSQPQVITREENGVKLEPFEEAVVDTPEEFQGVIIGRLGKRGFVLQNMQSQAKGAVTRLIFEGPTRGLLGFRNQFIIDTKGEGILSSRFIGFRPFAGEIEKRATGSMISMAKGKALGYALSNLQERGMLYIGPGVEVYEGQVIGNTAKGDEMEVNPTKGKHLTNMRASGSDDAIHLAPFFEVTIERGLEIVALDEYLEITPKSVRVRKQHLTKIARNRAKKQG